MKKIFLISLFCLVILASGVNATDCEFTEGCIDTFSQIQDVEIYQTCNNCTYCNFTNVRNNMNLDIINNVVATQEGSRFTYLIDKGNFSENGLGKYNYDFDCGNSVERKTGTLWFLVTPSGNSGTANIIFFILMIVMIYGITIFGFLYAKNIPITVLGSMAMIFLGIYMVNNGIIIFRDDLTNYIAYLTIASGFILGIWALLEQFEAI